VSLSLAISSSTRTIIIENPPILSPDSDFLIAKVTGYTSSISETDNDPFTTASNKPVRLGIVACPRKIAFGTKVEIDNLVYVCEDRTSRRLDGIFDIWFPDRQSAMNFGSQIKSVKIVKNYD
jgi:3D (Asp-Asp-Asp) domain-containing protein